MNFECILFQADNSVARITLNRPKLLNAMDLQTVVELRDAIHRSEEDDSIGAVVITGVGRAFCTGIDLDYIKTLLHDPQALRKWVDFLHQVLNEIEDCRKPVIAAVNGLALAGGLELVLVCDMAIAADEARLGDQHARFGLVAGGGATQRLPRLIGRARAKELLFTGNWLSAAEAERVGLVSKVVPLGQLEEAVKALTDQIVKLSQSGLALTKSLVNRGVETDLQTGLELEKAAVTLYIATADDAKEGIKAFEEKRVPSFRRGSPIARA